MAASRAWEYPMSERIIRLFSDENAATAREYGLIATAIAVVIIIVILSFTFADVSSAITS
jgi:Flp pilus assembly pilin Flp